MQTSRLCELYYCYHYELHSQYFDAHLDFAMSELHFMDLATNAGLGFVCINCRHIYSRLWRALAPGGVVQVDRVQSLLSYLSEHVHVSITLTFDMRLAFNTFNALNYTGTPLQCADMLRAQLVTAEGAAVVPGAAGNQVPMILSRWNAAMRTLDRLTEADNEEHVLPSWATPITIPKRAMAISSVSATLKDELIYQLALISSYLSEHSPLRVISTHDNFTSAMVAYFTTKFTFVRGAADSMVSSVVHLSSWVILLWSAIRLW